jgi:hypothetical protein
MKALLALGVLTVLAVPVLASKGGPSRAPSPTSEAAEGPFSPPTPAPANEGPFSPPTPAPANEGPFSPPTPAP